jgi:hypothetical protein
MINLLMAIISALFSSDQKAQENPVVDQQGITKEQSADQSADQSVTQSNFKPIFHS